MAAVVFKFLYGTSPSPDSSISECKKNFRNFRILQMTDLHLLDIDKAFTKKQISTWKASETTEVCLRKTLDLFRRILNKTKPDLVVFTGDIVDGRGKTTLDEFWQDLEHLLSVCQEFNVPWLYLPGNHECDNEEGYIREDLLNMYGRYPGSIIPDVPSSFDLSTSVNIGNKVLGIHTLDAENIAKSHYALNATQLDWIRAKTQVHDFNMVFIHEPFHQMKTEYTQLQGTFQPRGDKHDAEIFLQFTSGTLTDAFFGHNHHDDHIVQAPGSENWLGQGRVGSFFPPSEHEGRKPLPFPRGARVFDYNQNSLSTFIVEDQNGVLAEMPPLTKQLLAD